jgi:LacI family transcriptional regulator
MPHSGVLHDSRETARKMVRELLGLGFDSYAYVGWRERRDWSKEREEVFREEAARARKGFRAFSPWKGGRCASIVDYLERLEAFLVGLKRPCGVLAANDATAVHVLRIAEKAGIVVPDEMAVAGIDDDELVCENCMPTLTSVAPDFTRSGKLAIELLARRMAEPSARHEIVPFGSTDVVRRQSTRRFAQKDVRVVKAIEYIRLNACKGIGVADVVREMGVNPRSAELRFKEIAGHSMRDEILSVRIARAKEMLADPRNSVDAVAVACGYSDARALRHVFRTHLGISLRSCRS